MKEEIQKIKLGNFECKAFMTSIFDVSMLSVWYLGIDLSLMGIDSTLTDDNTPLNHDGDSIVGLKYVQQGM